MGYRLGVDLGTTFTAAAVDDGSGPAMVGLGNRALQVPSVLFLRDDGTFLCGEAAERRAPVDPGRVVREFKRRLGDVVPILIAGQPFSPQSLMAQLLSWVVVTVSERQGSAPDEVVLTHPANWGRYKQELFDQVISLADLPSTLTCTEPEAAATQYAARSRLSTGDRVAVYDLGGGTFDVCVLERGEAGFRIVGSPDGVEHLGGIDFDEAVFRHVLGQLGDVSAKPGLDDAALMSGLARLRHECVEAKEALSSDVEADVPVALAGAPSSVRITRAELDVLIGPALESTVAATRRALRSSRTDVDRLSAVVLVGGSSRIPLVSQMLQAEFHVRIGMDTHPKHDVAMGAALYHGRSPQASPLASGSGPVASSTTATNVPPGAPSTVQVDAASAHPQAAVPATGGRLRRRPSRSSLITSAAAVAALVVVAVVVLLLVRGPGSGSPPSARPSGAGVGSPTPTTSPRPTPALLPRTSLVVPIDAGGRTGLDLYAIGADGARTRLVTMAGTQRLPSISTDRKLLQFQSVEDDTSTPYVVRRGSRPTTMFKRQPPRNVHCYGRLAWSPTRGRAAMLCSVEHRPNNTPPPSSPAPTKPPSPTPSTTRPPSPTPSPTPTPSPSPSPTPTPSPTPSPTGVAPTPSPALARTLSNVSPVADTRTGAQGLRPAAVSPLRAPPSVPPGDPTAFLFRTDAQGRVDGRTMTPVKGFSDRLMSNLSFTGNGGLVVSYEGPAAPGIYYRPPGTRTEVRQLASGDVSDSVGIPTPDGGRVVFQRGRQLFMAATGTRTLSCPRETVPDPRTGNELCPLTVPDPRAPDRSDSDPTWSWDGTSIAFLRSTAGNSTVMRLDIDSPTSLRSVPRLDGSVGGAPSWSSR